MQGYCEDVVRIWTKYFAHKGLTTYLKSEMEIQEVLKLSLSHVHIGCWKRYGEPGGGEHCNRGGGHPCHR